MAIIPQPRLFSWDQVDAASDLDRLRRVLEALPDEALMQAIEAERKGKRDDYPLRAVWNSLVAGVVFQHVSVESLRRELQRNGELRQVCGFDPVLGLKAVPPPWVYTRLFHKLMARQADLDAMFDGLVERLGALLPDLGTNLTKPDLPTACLNASCKMDSSKRCRPLNALQEWRHALPRTRTCRSQTARSLHEFAPLDKAAQHKLA